MARMENRVQEVGAREGIEGSVFSYCFLLRYMTKGNEFSRVLGGYSKSNGIWMLQRDGSCFPVFFFLFFCRSSFLKIF